jgi:uncharacterized repeat protein (TIGR01451 family)
MDDAIVTALQNPAIMIDKSASPASVSAVGEVITYSYVVTNTGDVTLTNVTVSDTHISPDPICGPWTLAPGASMTCTAEYAVTQGDLDAGHIYNVGIGRGQPPIGPPVTDDDEVDVPTVQMPAITLDKSAAEASYDAVGDVIHYTFVITNTGNVTLNPVSLSDSLVGVTCDDLDMALAPGEFMTCTGSYTITQGDLDAGHVYNLATASGQPPVGAPVTATDEVDVPADQMPAIAIDKMAWPTTVQVAGSPIIYTYVVENTGNVTLHGVSVSDDLVGAITCPPIRWLRVSR